MKRIIIFVLVGLIMFGVGFGGGLLVGRTMADVTDDGSPRLQAPGPIVPLGEFTSNLACSGRNIISFAISLEVLNDRAAELVNSMGWNTRIRNEILLIVKDKIYEDLTSAEGALQLAEEIRRILNDQLPPIRGDVPILGILFESFSPRPQEAWFSG